MRHVVHIPIPEDWKTELDMFGNTVLEAPGERLIRAIGLVVDSQKDLFGNTTRYFIGRVEGRFYPFNRIPEEVQQDILDWADAISPTHGTLFGAFVDDFNPMWRS
jgi:hypothetical protein